MPQLKKHRTITITETVDYNCPICGKKVSMAEPYIAITSGKGSFRKNYFVHKACYKRQTKGGQNG